MASHELQTRKTILVVDDDAALRSSLEFILGVEGYAVRVYANGRELLNDTGIPDSGCLIIDQRLPDIDGLQLIEMLRNRGVTLAAILITTNPTQMLRRRADAAKIPIVEKPFITGALFKQITAALK
jgi:two-component system, LuxR family, response regulator FixJ